MTEFKATHLPVLPEADEVICLNVRRELYFSFADAYASCYDLRDEAFSKSLKIGHKN